MYVYIYIYINYQSVHACMYVRMYVCMLKCVCICIRICVSRSYLELVGDKSSTSAFTMMMSSGTARMNLLSHILVLKTLNPKPQTPNPKPP